MYIYIYLFIYLRIHPIENLERRRLDVGVYHVNYLSPTTHGFSKPFI